MKRSIVILCLLLIIGGVGLTWGHERVNAVREDVVFTETQVFGDRSAADGLTVETGANYDSHLHWDSVTFLSADAHATSTDYRFTYNYDYTPREATYHGLTLSTNREHTLNTEVDISELSGLALAYREAYEATEPGTESATVIHLADYYDVLPIAFQLDIPGLHLNGNYEYDYLLGDPNITIGGVEAHLTYNYQELMRTLQEYFSIPVPEDQAMTITIDRSLDGHSVGWGSSWGAGGVMSTGYYSVSTGTSAAIPEAPIDPVEEKEYDYYSMQSWSVYTDEAVYFTISDRTELGNRVDTSGIPGGHGIYRLPYGEIMGDMMVYCDQLKTVYPFAEGTRVVNFEQMADGSALLTTGSAEEGYEMTLFDLSTMEVLSTLFIPHYADLHYFRYFDGFVFIALPDGQFMLIEQTAEGLRLAIKAALLPAELGDTDYFPSVNYGSMAWDGERLAVAYWYEMPETYRETCGYTLAVYDATGMRYYGEYANSLTHWFDPERYGEEYVDADGSRGIVVRWN